MRSLFWTRRARADLVSIHSFSAQDSPHFADVVIARLFLASERLARCPESGREVPEFPGSGLRAVVYRPYRIVYSLVGAAEVHILTVHHSARRLPELL